METVIILVVELTGIEDAGARNLTEVVQISQIQKNL